MGVNDPPRSFGRSEPEPEQDLVPVIGLPPIAIPAVHVPVVLMVNSESLVDLAEQIKQAVKAAVVAGFHEALAEAEAEISAADIPPAEPVAAQ